MLIFNILYLFFFIGINELYAQPNLQKEVLYPYFDSAIDSIEFLISNDSLIQIDYYSYKDSMARANLLEWHNMDSSVLVYSHKFCRVFRETSNSVYFALKKNVDIFQGEEKIFSFGPNDTVQSIGYFYYSDHLAFLPLIKDKLIGTYIGEYVMEDTFHIFKEVKNMKSKIIERILFFKKGRWIPSKIDTNIYYVSSDGNAILFKHLSYMTKKMKLTLDNLGRKEE